MKNKTRGWLLATVLALGACTAGDKPPEPTTQLPEAAGKGAAVATATAEAQTYRGWYIEHEGQGLFQPCGDSQQLRVGSPELLAQAEEFGLDPDTPVYVILSATQTAAGEELSVARVEQFGSPTPVRDCAMTGLVMPETSGG